MSTFPLVQVEGALALPHMRPLNRVPPPFGREWSLMPSQFSLRTELHALYAAFLRTICLSAEAFRQTYRWDRQPRAAAEPPRPTAAPVGAAMNAAQAQQAAAEALGARTAGGTKTAQAAPRAQGAPAARTPPPSHKLTASAVAIGSAALLAWIVASHTQVRDDKGQSTLRASASPAAKADTQSSSRLADERALHDRSISGVIEGPKTAATPDASHEQGVAISSAVVAQRATPVPSPTTAAISATTTPSLTAGTASGTAPQAAPVQRAEMIAAAPAATAAPAVTRGKDTAPALAAAPATAKRPDFAMRAHAGKPVQSTLKPRAAGEKRTARSHQAISQATSATKANRGEEQAARSASSRHAVHEFAPHRSAPIVTTQRTHGMYSEAAEYSPHQFAVDSSDEYASLTTYANTRAAPRRAPVAADSTDWVNHVAQRRVTEVPDHFEK
ncbi:hypothetical protein [Paraburkholderia bannensis]|uniref:hypothetical protein n=1 Tax=Paraburkholderia bannensis TaxID=765414 RepID=UPI002ABE9ECF|nr:hypothetical protein [Paraburkholderia bannensis]